MAFDESTFRNLPQHGVVGWWPQGTVGQQTIIDYFRLLGQIPDANAQHRYVDLSAVQDFSFGYQVINELAQLRQTLLSDHRGIKLVMMSEAPLGYGMARMYQAFMANFDMEIRVFQSVAPAASFLGIPEHVLMRPEAPLTTNAPPP